MRRLIRSRTKPAGVCVCVCVPLTAAAPPVCLQSPRHAAADGSGRFTGADLLTASVDVLAPVGFYEDSRAEVLAVLKVLEVLFVSDEPTQRLQSGSAHFLTSASYWSNRQYLFLQPSGVWCRSSLLRTVLSNRT